ncbi:hypothetical protein [Ferrimonas balearica]|uniref:hypothetical protein n=1 Tax=Ferrimonas balearica TaxID=44012 RepID=UPI001F324DD0|nr:hypothetical protein [Ferrimonas balearica]MBY6095125.1 hypothetical protein [Ferrimonas balearica]
MRVTLQSGEIRPFPTGARWLNVISASGAFIIANHDQGLPDTTMKGGWIADVQDFTAVELQNPGAEAVTIELQCSALRIQASGSNSVEVSNAVVVERINQALQVTASATVDGGTMANLSANRHQALATKTINPGETVKLCDARMAAGRAVLMQVLSADDTTAQVRISHEAPGESSGLMLLGSAIAPALHRWAAETAVYMRNTGTAPAIVTGAEIWRQPE